MLKNKIKYDLVKIVKFALTEQSRHEIDVMFIAIVLFQHISSFCTDGYHDRGIFRTYLVQHSFKMDLCKKPHLRSLTGF